MQFIKSSSLTTHPPVHYYSISSILWEPRPHVYSLGAYMTECSPTTANLLKASIYPSNYVVVFVSARPLYISPDLGTINRGISHA